MAQPLQPKKDVHHATRLPPKSTDGLDFYVMCAMWDAVCSGGNPELARMLEQAYTYHLLTNTHE